MSATAASPAAARLLAEALAGHFPDARGRFGPFGGRYVPEMLIPALERLERGVREHLHASDFQAELAAQLSGWVGRPTALTFAPRLSSRWGANVWLKREDLAHTGAHKINNAIGQAPSASSLRPAPGSMESRAPRPARGSDSRAPCTWVRSTWSARRRTWGVCGCSARASCRS